MKYIPADLESTWNIVQNGERLGILYRAASNIKTKSKFTPDIPRY